MFIEQTMKGQRSLKGDLWLLVKLRRRMKRGGGGRGEEDTILLQSKKKKKGTGLNQFVAPPVAPGYGWSESVNWELRGAAAAWFP